MKPPGSTPTGTTSMSISLAAICTRTGGMAARTGCRVLRTMGTSTAGVGAADGLPDADAEGAPTPLGDGAGAHAVRARISTRGAIRRGITSGSLDRGLAVRSRSCALPAPSDDHGDGCRCRRECEADDPERLGQRVTLGGVAGGAGGYSTGGGVPDRDRLHREGEVAVFGTAPRVDDREHAVLRSATSAGPITGSVVPARATAADTVPTGRSSLASSGLTRPWITGAPSGQDVDRGRGGDVAHRRGGPGRLPWSRVSLPKSGQRRLAGLVRWATAV